MKTRVLFSAALLGLLTMIGVFISCNRPTEFSAMHDETMPKPNLVAIEASLDKLASLLPEVMKEPELAKFLYDEAKINAAKDEAYAFWDRIADRQTEQGMTIREGVINQLSKSLGKKTSEGASTFTADLDAIDNLQVYIHNFDKWDGVAELPTTFASLTIDDIELEEVVLYNPDGSVQVLPIEDEPDYPVMVVGINESAVSSQVETNCQVETNLAKQTTTTIDYHQIYCEYVSLRKGRDLEPWPWGECEIVVRRKYGEECNESQKQFNPPSSTQACQYAYNGYLPSGGVVRISTDDYNQGNTVSFEAFEYDLFVNEWIVNLGNVKDYGWYFSVDIYNEGDYYDCGIYERLDYNWIRATDKSVFDCN